MESKIGETSERKKHHRLRMSFTRNLDEISFSAQLTSDYPHQLKLQVKKINFILLIKIWNVF